MKDSLYFFLLNIKDYFREMSNYWNHRLNNKKSFVVIYPSGDRTNRLPYTEAIDLAKIFDGRILFVPEK